MSHDVRTGLVLTFLLMYILACVGAGWLLVQGLAWGLWLLGR